MLFYGWPRNLATVVRTIRISRRLLPIAALFAISAGLAARLAALPVRRDAPPAAPVSDGQGTVTYQDLRRTVIFGIALVLTIWFGLWFIARTQDVLVLVAMAVILAVALRPTVDRLSSDRIPYVGRTARRAIAILTLYLALGTVVAAIGLLIVPQLIVESEKLITNGPDYLEQLDRQMSSLPGYGLLPPLQSLPGQVTGQVLANLPQAVNVLFLALNTVTGLLSIVVVLVLTFFLIMDADPIYSHFTSLLPPGRRGQARQLTARMGGKIEGWLKGIIVLSAFVGVGTTIAMWLLGMPYPLLLGVGAAVAELVPLAGPYLASAPGLIVALFQPTWKLIAVAIFFLILQMTENHILAPMVMGREVEIPPLLVIVALLLGASMLGIVGAVLAVPVAAVIQVLWMDLVVPEVRHRHMENGRQEVRNRTG